MKKTIWVVLLAVMLGFRSYADELKKDHKLVFGKISHKIPSEIFKKPRTIARLINPGITEEYRFEETGDASAVMIITKIRKDYPKGDSLLDKTTPRNVAMQKHFGKEVVLLRTVSKAKPRIEEMVFLNAEYDQKMFPYGIGGKNLKGEVKSLAISQTFVQDGLYIECAMHLKIGKGEKKEDFVKRAQTLCSKWQKTVKAEKKK